MKRPERIYLRMQRDESGMVTGRWQDLWRSEGDVEYAPVNEARDAVVRELVEAVTKWSCSTSRMEILEAERDMHLLVDRLAAIEEAESDA